jgi:aryl-alcohol dehydrogenase-like predicted oxidoreductase
VVATKIPPKNGRWPAPEGVDPEDAFPADHVRACTERSLRNLGLDAIDVQQFHVWSDEWAGRGSWRQAIEGLKAEGKIRAFGVSINDHQPWNALKLIESGAVDTVQVIYNVFDQSPEDELLPACAEHGIGVLARVPFDEGALTGTIGPDTEFPEGDFRNRYFRGDRRQQVAERVQAILDDLGIEREQLPEVALRYVLSEPAVSAVIPGMRSVRNVERNCAVGDGRGLPAERVAALKRHRWDRNFYR